MTGEICRFHNKPGGCRRGIQCKFRHVDSLARQTSFPPAAVMSMGETQIADNGTWQASAQNPANAKAPSGVCSFYWTKGDCSRGFQCRYKHIAKDANRRDSQGQDLQPSTTAMQAIAPFLTKEGLARLADRGTDGFFAVDTSKPLSPSEVHNYLKRFLFDSYRFKNVVEIYSFLNLISNATANNVKWTPEDGQLLLSTLSSGNALLRINDIIRWSDVSVSAGSQKTVLSFQRGYLPLLRYFSSEFVVNSVATHSVNALYALILEDFDHFTQAVESCMEQAVMTAKSFKDPIAPAGAAKDPTGSQVIATITKVLFEFITRFKNATATHPSVYPLVLNLRKWTDAWISGISSTPPAFNDVFATTTPQAREHIIQHLNNQVNRLVAIVDRKHNETQRAQKRVREVPVNLQPGTDEAILAALENSYEGPGELRPNGPRHDNDFVNTSDIRIAPTHDELTCRIPPFLPANIYGAPHPLPAESMEKLLDIQFRLLREELTAPLRLSIQLLLDDLLATRTSTRLAELLKARGGKYRGHAEGQEAVLFNVYTNVGFLPIQPDHRGLSVGLSLDTPPGRARSPQSNVRMTFWENMASKRLMQGGLIALVWQRPGDQVAVHLGTIASSTKELVESVRQVGDRVRLRVAFFDPEVELRILQELKHPERERVGTRVLVEATVMYESIRPFLEALRVEPELVPFSQYLVHRPPGFLKIADIAPPAYARIPDYTFQLSSLFPAEAEVQDLKLSVTDPASISAARELLRTSSRLDSSQADAVVEALTRELVLIQGPPGTGKSYTGVELLRVLLANKAGPILMIAFTNHALDHMLGSVLDAKITTKIVRLGSRSADERISQYSIENMEHVAGKNRLDRAFAGNHRALRDVEEEIKKLMHEFAKTRIESPEILDHLRMQYPLHLDSLTNPPEWVNVLYTLSQDDSGESWRVVGKNGRGVETDDSLYTYWREGRDLDFIDSANNPKASTAERHPSGSMEPSRSRSGPNNNVFAALANADPPEDEEIVDDAVSLDSDELSDSDLEEFPPEEEWIHLVEEAETPDRDSDGALELPATDSALGSAEPLPTDGIQTDDFENVHDFLAAFNYVAPQTSGTDRDIAALLEDGSDDVWAMTRSERERLHAHWLADVRSTLQETRMMEFERLRERHASALQKYTEGKNESRRQLLKNVDIVGCTTTGAAKLTSLLKGIGPRIMLVEEAGQVLEAHVLGSLVPTVEHLILIGDPLQLRPTLNNFSLSMDNKRGRMLFRFDMSLMERLSNSELPMSQINVQRRMRPEIADLVRNYLYPRLEDHDLVKHYPPVRGMAKDVFFLSHKHRENGSEDDSVSKYNMFEVNMIKDLVLYLLRQGTYSAEGDIVVLCAYLGQLARMRDALASEVAVVIDARDQAELDEREVDGDVEATSGTVIERVKVSRRVRLRTVDNYQGEEAKIVILSLVRNSGGSEDDETVYGHASLQRTNIGFLKSRNRTNVALSRAREGLYILGNAPDLSSKGDMWRSVISDLERSGSVGDAFPVRCHRHPDHTDYISKPGQLPRIAPDGGCLRQCDTRLQCGHLCPYKCHSDDPNHLAVECVQRCMRLCVRGHPCTKQCADPCGRCMTRVENVTLPCGHVTPYVLCYQLDELSDVPCNVNVTRRLTHCEHEAAMRCSDDPARFVCKAVCGGTMPCCGRPCKARCHQCQGLNRVEDEDESVGIVARLQHTSHPCERQLYCGHLCGKACTQDHECTTLCKEPCRQVCRHARCRNYCSAPCAPCQEPCTWQCEHYSCPVPCGSVCARLPCDKRCKTILQCGHRCPSVCGEECFIQVCPICAVDEVRSSVVDLIMQRTLADVEPENETLDDLLITIPACGHVFTVETLDGHCGMSEYYRREGIDGKWLGLQAPPIGFQKPPTCPTCRAALTAPRYGRVFKRADLDILENNVASSMSRSLGRIQADVQSIAKGELETRLPVAAEKILPGRMNVQVKAILKKQRSLLRATRDSPIPRRALDPADGELHGIPISDAKEWKKITFKILAAYGDAVKVAETRSAHVRAWQASFAYLFQNEMDRAASEPERAPKNPQEYAMRVARMGVGQPQPRADKRFVVEAIWVTINLRLMLSDLGAVWMEGLHKRESYPARNRRAWGAYVLFILRSCAADAQIALGIAEESGSRRQKTRTALLLMRVSLERFRFNILMARQDRRYQEERTKLQDAAANNFKEASDYVETVMEEHRRARGDAAESEEIWLAENFSQAAMAIIDEWRAIEKSIREETFYSPVSLDELTAVAQSFSFGSSAWGHAGHFYKCPNGHLYVITECGGAMQEASCPECGERIGGGSHRLISTNSRAADVEALAGAGPSPWQ
ncbi:P-loop containing nucleoside triphosphate hydrolase protein [Laetiporus sulphureus 93-53]|uniref:p-loop containing nucleoside triphosphate hydrolase protein n=1 Tax=Laetiporus sulphureus 93-53 TaxID=1314785 RepID=A0A165GQA6_9APHY|nr:P-loop containing nucleoside triphosphate hydrolase protein [Laetiporus sulphureus 93-53]KZT10660.1 P-loop containing nucleoside triphosphate hydrolase protein [Laetiporus sulphureus 93-53]